MLWPDRLEVGDRVRFGGRACTITDLYGRLLTLTDAFGGVHQVDVVALLQSNGFVLLDQGHAPARDQQELIGEAAERARWWRSHIVEVLTGRRWDAPPGSLPREPYDPDRHSLGERETAKAEELARAGVRGASVRTVRRKRQRYEAEGLAGLADGRAGRRAGAGGRWDPHITDALRDAAFDSAGRRRSVEAARLLVTQRLESAVQAGELTLPSRSSFHRLYAELTSAGGLYGPQRRPGRTVVLDAVRLPALAGAYAVRGGLRLVLAIDVDTAVLLAAVVDEGLRPLDGAALLARMCVPADERASWGAWPPSSQQTTERQGAPVIRPEVLVVDRSPALSLRGLTEACRRHGVKLRYRTGTHPADKEPTEKLTARAASLFMDHLRSSAGDSARAAGWPADRVQALLDDWVQEVWSQQELPACEGSLTAPAAPGSPALRYAALVARNGWITPPLEPVEYLDLLPVTRRVISRSGVHLRGRRYDSPGLDGFRRHLPPSERTTPWSVCWDPYDTRQIWIHTPRAGWLTVPSVSLAPSSRKPSPQPAHTDGDVRSGLTHSPVIQGNRRGTYPAEYGFNGTDREPFQPPPPVTAPDQTRVAYHAQLPLYTPDLLAAVERVGDLIVLNEHAAGARHGILVTGEAGTGKTTVLQELARRFTARFPAAPDDGTMPVVQVRLPPGVTGQVLLRELARAVAATVPARATTADLVARVHDCLTIRRTRLVLVDEFHHFRVREGQASSLTEVVAHLCDSVQATFVFAGFPPRTGEWSSHRRLLPLTLSSMAPGDAWLELIWQAESALRLRAHVPGTLTELADHLHELTGGSARHLSYLVRSGSIRAIREGAEQLTRPLLDDLASPWRTPVE